MVGCVTIECAVRWGQTWFSTADYAIKAVYANNRGSKTIKFASVTKGDEVHSGA